MNLLDWLSLNRKISFEDAKWLGPIITAALGLISLFLIVVLFALFVRFFLASFGLGAFSNDTNAVAIRNIGLVLVGIIGTPLIIWRTIIASKQVKLGDESLFNEKIKAAAEGLSARRQVSIPSVHDEGAFQTIWEDDLSKRVSSIDQLEGLARERESEALRIARLIASYVRATFTAGTLEPTENLVERAVPRMDLQKAIDTLGRLLPVARNFDNSEWRIDLTYCNFDGVSFRKGNFYAANFSNSRFEASILREGAFEGALFYNCLMNYSDFSRACLKGARLDHIVINRPTPVPGGFIRSINMANTYGITLIASDITGMDHLGSTEEISQIFATNDTLTSRAAVREKLPFEEHSLAHSLLQNMDPNEMTEQQKLTVNRLIQSGFRYWSPFDHEDLATGFLVQQFQEDLDLSSWPYTG